MNNFFRSFFAALLALFVFSIITTVISLVLVGILVMSTKKENSVGQNAVLVVDLSQRFTEVSSPSPLNAIANRGADETPSLYDLLRMIRHAASDGMVKGIYLKCGSNSNGFAASEEIRRALLDFKRSRKFIYAYSNELSQKAYYVATAADSVFCHPMGGVEWHGFAMQIPFIKGTLQKLEIEPQIFYAGKFKSATEPLRETKMTEANKLQSTELLYDLYNDLLQKTSARRGVDTATLHRYADSNLVQFASAALGRKMVDGVKYDDQVKNHIRIRLGISKDDDINFITPGKYAAAVSFKETGTDKIVVIYAEGNIVDGKGERANIGGDTYRNLIRDARTDKSVKAIVVRINSGGGSAMASDVMWREIVLAKKVKPVIVSFGDVAASGGYYMACGADSIFAEANTITGSIGVFGILPNMQNFFNDKLGVTFDGVKTSPDADLMTITHPLSPAQKMYIQNEIDTIYMTFKKRVAEGRKKSVEYVDSIAQGRVWSGARAVGIGLVDRIGSLDDAIAAAAKKAGVKSYRLREYPEKQGILEYFLQDHSSQEEDALIRSRLGNEGFKTYAAIRDMQQYIGKVQAKLPYEMIIE